MNILFIGNSHTYFHGMPYQVRELLLCLGIRARVTMIAQPGESLAWHCQNPATKLALRYENWHHIILQQVTHPFPGHDALFDGVSRLLRLMPDGQSVWLYKTWCEKAKPGNQAGIDRAFAAVSGKLSLPVVPVSDAWHEIGRRDPYLELYHIDGEHAGRVGSYVTALCMTRALSDRPVSGLPSQLRHADRVINRVSPSAAKLFQTVVDEIFH
jgi:hypothetical protein